MGHTWKAQIIRSDGSSLTFADGDDVAVTAGLRLLAEPTVALERNVPRKAVMELPTSPTAGRNPRSSSFSAWSSGPAGAIARGMHVRVWQTDAASGTEVQTFQGRIRRIDRDGDRVVLTAYDDLMELAELREPATFFHRFRDRIGGRGVGGKWPDISIAFDSEGRITATLPDTDIVQPLTRVTLAEPQDTFAGAMSNNTGSISLLDRHLAVVFVVEKPVYFYRFKIRLKTAAGSGPYPVQVYLRHTTWNGSRYVPADTGICSYTWNLPSTDGQYVTFESTAFHSLLNPGRYAIVITNNQNVEVGTSPYNSEPAFESTYDRPTYEGALWSRYTTFSPQMCIQTLVDREIGPESYRIDGSTITVAQGDTTIRPSDLSTFANHLHVSYFYGRLSQEEIMERLVRQAGMTPARAGTLAQGAASIGYYHTSTRNYLDCLRELADMWEETQGHQWTVSMDMAADLSSKTVRIGRRRRPWAEAIDSHTFGEGALGAGMKRILDSQLRETFEAKVATMRVLGQAFDGSPVAAQVDDRLWGVDSLVEQTGAELMDYSVDRAVATSGQAARTAEAVIREQHQNHLEGTLQLSGRWPSIWDQDPASNGCGASRIVGLTSERDGLEAAKAVARRIELGGGHTMVELDNVRQPDRSMIRRTMDKAMAAEAFNVATLPAVAYIFARVGDLPAAFISDGLRNITLRREDGLNVSSELTGTRIIRSDDHCAPDGRGYTHFQVYIPPHTRNGPTSYIEGAAGGVSPFTRVYAYSLGTTATVSVDIRPQWIWSHQAVLVDLYGRRP